MVSLPVREKRSLLAAQEESDIENEALEASGTEEEEDSFAKGWSKRRLCGLLLMFVGLSTVLLRAVPKTTWRRAPSVEDDLVDGSHLPSEVMRTSPVPAPVTRDFWLFKQGSPRCQQAPPQAMWRPWQPSFRQQVKVLSYNLFWWNLYGKNDGRDDSAGKLIKQSMSVPYDVMGFQECEDPARVLGGVGLLTEYKAFQGNHAMCMAYRKSVWTLIRKGEMDIAEDQPTEHYGPRGAQWMRLKRSASGEKLLFVNHHGPLSVNSGGQCGGVSTATALLKLVADKGVDGDLVIIVGDFNANAASRTIQELWKNLVLVYNGDSFGGVDNIFSNSGSSVAHTTLGSGGSDHNAIAAIVEIGAGTSVTAAAGGQFRFSSFSSKAVSPEPSKAVRDSYGSQCGRLESGIEYVVSGNSKDLYDIKDPRKCCDACQNTWRCKSWVLTDWVAEKKGPRCSLQFGLPEKRQRKDGVVSGLTVSEAAKAASQAAASAIREVKR